MPENEKPPAMRVDIYYRDVEPYKYMAFLNPEKLNYRFN